MATAKPPQTPSLFSVLRTQKLVTEYNATVSIQHAYGNILNKSNFAYLLHIDRSDNRSIRYASVVFDIVKVIACLCCKDDDHKMTN